LARLFLSFKGAFLMRKFLLIALMLVVGGFLLIQLLPYGRSHTNPPVISEPAWDSPQTKELAQRACYDCHSNETVWPWYSNIAPVSWLVQYDVEDGRQQLNFSEWGSSRRDGEEGDEMAEVIYKGEMPPANYLLTHPEARLTDAEKQILANGMAALGGGEYEREGREAGGESEEYEEYEDDD
jgi:hypothetical protein